ncbi:hypothetical protein CMQ_3204 [Grosmannia clavigera kw1407]|uniref:Uncharacterized protein n=1 Tax=Grosmannia clavigera (strain kw1407 / UAMH 11150) TaxID=655863 RepID=F0XHH4_GROCL|nr:uncharacterized protein CMQ_3204 [Grosmannia clavigera kw1407]EFX03275.1 hypothetical protein CMQ_3204 [Grosmannia clavigera kw1407]
MEPHSQRGRRQTSSVSLSGSSRRSASSDKKDSSRWQKGCDRNRGRNRGRSRGRSRSRSRDRNGSTSLETGGGERLRHRGKANQKTQHRRGGWKRSLSRSLSGSSGDGTDYNRRRSTRNENSHDENHERDERPARQQSPTGRRRRINTSSVSSRSKSRDKSADVLDKDDIPAATTTVQPAIAAATTMSADHEPASSASGQPQAAQRLVNEKREKELKEKIKQMRSR